jgi:hypothetical protein
MKKSKLLLLSSAILLLCSCNDILDTKNLYQKDLNSYYDNPTGITEAMSGVYNSLYVSSVLSDEELMDNLMSDLMLGGGGPDDKIAKYIDSFQDPEEDTYKDLWVETYNGIYRCNAIIEAVGSKDYSSYFKSAAEADQFKKQNLGEAYFMRGFLLFRAARFFGGMPLIMKTDTQRNLPRASFEETFTQILSDFKAGMDTMPNTRADQIPESDYGHANRWIAEGYVARAFLFYTGYMTNIEKKATTSVKLLDGTTLDKTAVVGYLDDCIKNSGYKLLSDFRNLWPYSYVNEAAGKVVLPWADKEGLKWAGQDGFHPTYGTGNSEVMFAQRYTISNWDIGQKYNDRIPLYFAIRNNSMVPFGAGWGWGTVNSLLYNSWSDADKRKEGSILPMGVADEGTDKYKKDQGDHETGFFNKKYTTLQYAGADGVKGMFYYLYNATGSDMQNWCAQDYYYMRFADILLMQSELSETVEHLNEVRVRAGLTPLTAYSLAALKEERLHEFAFEGTRYMDLVRWGDVEGTNNFYKEIDVSNSGVKAKYNVKYRPETKGLVPIPESEIRLSNGVYTQNPGWD